MRLTVLRHGTPAAGPADDGRVQGQAVVGVQLGESFVFPFTREDLVGNIGGPSAGLMFALGIIDKLTPDNLTGGRFIAGTGEIEANGRWTRSAGSSRRWPAPGSRRHGLPDPGRELPGHRRRGAAGLRLIKVSTLTGAVAALDALKASRPVPGC